MAERGRTPEGCLVNSCRAATISMRRGAPREHESSVANFVQEMLKGQLPLSMRGLRGHGVELFGRGEALLNSVFKLPFSQHVHQFDADESGLRCVKRFES